MNNPGFVQVEFVEGQSGTLRRSWTDAHQSHIELAIAMAASHISPPINRTCSVSVLLTHDAQQRDLNRDWRNIDRTTNVLSFPNDDDMPHASQILGDISLAFETIYREAKDQQKSFDHHLSHLAIHAFLHLLGYDHIEDDDAQKMEALEVQILAALGIHDPYAPIEDD